MLFKSHLILACNFPDISHPSETQRNIFQFLNENQSEDIFLSICKVLIIYRNLLYFQRRFLMFYERRLGLLVFTKPR